MEQNSIMNILVRSLSFISTPLFFIQSLHGFCRECNPSCYLRGVCLCKDWKPLSSWQFVPQSSSFCRDSSSWLGSHSKHQSWPVWAPHKIVWFFCNVWSTKLFCHAVLMCSDWTDPGSKRYSHSIYVFKALPIDYLQFTKCFAWVLGLPDTSHWTIIKDQARPRTWADYKTLSLANPWPSSKERRCGCWSAA